MVNVMVRFLVYINNKLKTDGRFTFSGIVGLTEPCPPLRLTTVLSPPDLVLNKESYEGFITYFAFPLVQLF